MTTGARARGGSTSREQLRDGFETVTNLLARTLGPSGGTVLNEIGRGSSESLTDSATVVRRITSLPGSHASAGAAVVADLVRRVCERYGDGGATAAVLAQAMLAHAARVTAAGANAVLVRRGIQLGVAAACDALKDQADAVAGEGSLVRLATAMTADPELAGAVGELLDNLGPDGAIQVEEHLGGRLSYEYVDGARWRARPADRQLLSAGNTELTLVDPVVVVADLELTEVGQARALLEVVRAMPARSPALVLARDICGEALTMFRLNDMSGAIVSAPVVLTTPAVRMADDLADIATLTGAQVLSADAGRPVEAVRAAQVGGARRALVERGYVTISGGRGDRTAVTELAARLRTRAWELDQRPVAGDGGAGERLRLRQARLLGRVAALRVGAPTEQQVDDRKGAARRAVRLLRTALHQGAVPGGGVAFLDCLPAVRARRAACAGTDEALGLDAVIAGLQAPFLRIVRNAGVAEPGVALAAVRERGPGYGVDAGTGEYVKMRDAGIEDVAGVSAGALEAAGEIAGLLVCAEVVAGHG